MISTQMAVEIMKCAFKTEICMFNLNKSEFNVNVAITSDPVEASKKIPNTHKNKNNMNC